jgi:hypothetical protein
METRLASVYVTNGVLVVIASLGILRNLSFFVDCFTTHPFVLLKTNAFRIMIASYFEGVNFPWPSSPKKMASCDRCHQGFEICCRVGGPYVYMICISSFLIHFPLYIFLFSFLLRFYFSHKFYILIIFFSFASRHIFSTCCFMTSTCLCALDIASHVLKSQFPTRR